MALQFLRRLFQGKPASSPPPKPGGRRTSREAYHGQGVDPERYSEKLDDYAADVLLGKNFHGSGKRNKSKTGGVNFGWPSADPDDRKREYGDGSYLEDFLYNGMVLWVDSSWVESARYARDREELEIVFKDGWAAYYGECDIELARDFAETDSKGKWIHKNCKEGYQSDGKHWIHSRSYRHD